MGDVRRCARCKEDKPVSAFGWTNKAHTERHAYCHACHIAYRRARYGKSPNPNPITRRDGPRPTTWRCAGCGEVKPVTEFFRGSSYVKGFQSRCKVCTLSDRRQRNGWPAEPTPRTKPGDAKPTQWRCVTCREVKPSSAFYANTQAPKGFDSRCKACWAIYARSARGKLVHRRYHTSAKALARSRVSGAARRTARHGLPATLTHEEWARALRYFSQGCAYCGAEGRLVQEHFIPVTKGGPYSAATIVPACYACNNSKRDRSPRAWCAPDAYWRILRYFASLLR